MVCWWHHRQVGILTDADTMVTWLNDEWRSLDRWITSVERGRSATADVVDDLVDPEIT